VACDEVNHNLGSWVMGVDSNGQQLNSQLKARRLQLPIGTVQYIMFSIHTMN